MSLLSSFITNQLIKSLEAEFIAHEPQMQEAFINELGVVVNKVVQWLNDKVDQKSKQSGASQ